MDNNLPTYRLPEIDVAYNDFKKENEKSMPTLINFIGERGLYLVFASGYIKCFDKMAEELKNFKF